MKVSVFDYGAGNLHSLLKTLDGPGVTLRVSEALDACLDGDLLVLPGVGAFAPAAERMKPGLAKARAAIREGLPVLGVCLGMQLLFERSEEGPGEGLAIFAGDVVKLAAKQVPQIGWNALDDVRGAPFDRSPLTYAYYANGFVCRPKDASEVVAWSTHESDRFAAAVRRGDCLGVQFHPEKSSAEGVRFVKAFLEELS